MASLEIYRFQQIFWGSEIGCRNVCGSDQYIVADCSYRAKRQAPGLTGGNPGDLSAMDGLAPAKTIEVLLIENNPADARLTEKSLRAWDVPTKINHVRDGVQALAFLRREGAYRQAPKPDLLLIDLNLTRVGARELVAQIKRDPNLRTIPVVVLTPAVSDAQIAKTFDVQADCFIAKPVDAEKFATALGVLATQNNEAETGLLTATSIDGQQLVNLAHELRTHLNPIIAFAEIMQLEIRGPLSSDYREYARGIHQSALALSRIVLELLDRSKSELIG
jgi:two-component system, chemotaxis family, response regulator Rcp1